MQKQKRLWTRIGIGLTSLCLMTSLTACGVKPRIQQPPAALLRDCVETRTELDLYKSATVNTQNVNKSVLPQEVSRVITNGDLVMKIRSLRVDLQTCTADKAALREWYRVYSR